MSCAKLQPFCPGGDESTHDKWQDFMRSKASFPTYMNCDLQIEMSSNSKSPLTMLFAESTPVIMWPCWMWHCWTPVALGWPSMKLPSNCSICSTNASSWTTSLWPTVTRPWSVRRMGVRWITVRQYRSSKSCCCQDRTPAHRSSSLRCWHGYIQTSLCLCSQVKKENWQARSAVLAFINITIERVKTIEYGSTNCMLNQRFDWIAI